MQEFDTNGTVPRIIWSYWHQGIEGAPNPVPACVESLFRHNSEYDIRVLDAESVRDYLPKSELDALRSYPQFLRADRIRLSLLEKYGGIWVDPTVYFRSSISEVIPKVPRDGFFTLINRNPDRIEYWLLVAPRGSEAIQEIRKRHIKYFSAWRLHKPRGRWVKLKRGLEASLNKSHRSAVYWARFPLNWFPAYPYFIFCYIADDVVKRRRHLPDLWGSGYFPLADEANALMHEARRKETVSRQRVVAQMARQAFPISKLSYHLGNPEFWELFVQLHKENYRIDGD